MKVYIAAHYSRKEEMIQIAHVMQDYGIEVTSSWLLEPHKPQTTMDEINTNMLMEYALKDKEDIARADAFVLFSFDPLLPACRGGHNVETGMALALKRPVYVVGPFENIFHYLPEVQHFVDLAALLKVLRTK